MVGTMPVNPPEFHTDGSQLSPEDNAQVDLIMALLAVIRSHESSAKAKQRKIGQHGLHKIKAPNDSNLPKLRH